MSDDKTEREYQQKMPGDQRESSPELSLADLVIEFRGLPDELSSRTVPEALMQIPIVYAIDWLDHHRRDCRQQNNCNQTPRPLRILLKVHNRDAILRSAALIHTELWREGNTTMVRQVRERVLSHERNLVAVLDDQDALAVEGLHDVVEEQRLGVLRMAAVLWALGLVTRDQRRLFRLLPALLPDIDQHTEPTPTPAEPRQAPEKGRQRRRREAAEARVSELKEEVDQLKSERRERAETNAHLTQDLERARGELDKAHQSVEQLQRERDDRVAESRELKVQLTDSERDAHRSQEVSTRLRDGLATMEKRTEDLERERRRLTRDLALANTRIESTEAALGAVPRGKDAIDAFLADEERRIEEDLIILQGGDRQRAEAEHTKRQKLERAFRDAYPEYVPPRPDAIGEKRSLQFTAIGGGAEVGRSAYLVEIGSSRILVDCGIAVGRTDPVQMAPDLTTLGRIDALVLTHAHTDHIGWVPALVHRQDPDMPIYCSEDTAAITPIMLEDARGHYERMLARDQRNAAHNPDAVPMTEEYTRDDLFDVETRLHAVRFDDPRNIAGTAVKLSLFNAGHILGAAIVLLEGGGRKVVISGDISTQHQETVPPASPPRDITDVDLLVLESTYGRGSRNGGDPRVELVDFVRQTTERGTAILPCFALGRGQEVLQILLRAKQDGRLDPAVTIWVDGLIRQIVPVYTERGRLDQVGFQMVEPGERSMAVDMCRRPDARAVVVTTSGMLNGGPVVEWAQALLPESRNHMALLGYQDEASAGGSLGRMRRERRRPPFELVMPQEDGSETRLTIASTIREIGLSAHADQDGLVGFARAIHPRRIALVHGDPEAQEALENRLIRELPDTEILRPGSVPLAVP